MTLLVLLTFSWLIGSGASALALFGVDRRAAVVASVGLATVIGQGAVIDEAAAAADAGEAIRRGAANIPGYGPTDVFYPQLFQGKWKVVRDIVGDQTVAYEVRFIQSIESHAVVADRGYNQAALEKALTKTAARSYEWAETNPNDLRLALEDGSRTEIKVTKRSSERTEDTVSSSEFQRITTEDSRTGGIPVICARRTLTKWKVMSESAVEGLEIVYDMGGGDPLTGTAVSAGPQVISKSRLHLERIQ